MRFDVYINLKKARYFRPKIHKMHILRPVTTYQKKKTIDIKN
jgi:hypothetical protein